jgi:hypothetical protein
MAEGLNRKKEIFLAQHAMKKFEGWGNYLTLRGKGTLKGVGEEVNIEKLHVLEFLSDVGDCLVCRPSHKTAPPTSVYYTR